MNQSTTETERDVEQTRAEIQRDADELRRRTSIGNVADEVGRQLGAGGGQEFLRNLRRQVEENPMAALLIGVGIAWLMLGGRRDRYRRAEQPETVPAPEPVHTPEYEYDPRSGRRASELPPIAGEPGRSGTA